MHFPEEVKVGHTWRRSNEDDVKEWAVSGDNLGVHIQRGEPGVQTCRDKTFRHTSAVQYLLSTTYVTKICFYDLKFNIVRESNTDPDLKDGMKILLYNSDDNVILFLI